MQRPGKSDIQIRTVFSGPQSCLGWVGGGGGGGKGEGESL